MGCDLGELWASQNGKAGEQESSKGHKKGEFPCQMTLSYFQITRLASSFSLSSGATGEHERKKEGFYLPAISVRLGVVPHPICKAINKRDVLLRDCHGNIFRLPGCKIQIKVFD